MKDKLSKEEYVILTLEMERLLKETEGIQDLSNPKMIELNLISDRVADYEEEHFPVK